MGFCNCSIFVVLLCVRSSFAIFLLGMGVGMGGRGVGGCFTLSFCCLIIVVWLFLVVPQVCLQYVIVVFPDHTHFSDLEVKQVKVYIGSSFGQTWYP